VLDQSDRKAAKARNRISGTANSKTQIQTKISFVLILATYASQKPSRVQVISAGIGGYCASEATRTSKSNPAGYFLCEDFAA
jgi:hypothetical protein